MAPIALNTDDHGKKEKHDQKDPEWPLTGLY
jgi:hypothetical protein